MKEHRRKNPARLAFLSIAAFACTVLGVVAHCYVGWADQGKPVIHPVGHLTVFAALIWLVAIALSLTTTLAASGYRWWGIGCLVAACAGLALLIF
ncbi:MAG: hypothetical protein KF715_03095 [Candidatus Didemnitutus sp.]|nr:hypothetical protein [Candidatus Didemnitutus sp.]